MALSLPISSPACLGPVAHFPNTFLPERAHHTAMGPRAGEMTLLVEGAPWGGMTFGIIANVEGARIPATEFFQACT